MLHIMAIVLFLCGIPLTFCWALVLTFKLFPNNMTDSKILDLLHFLTPFRTCDDCLLKLKVLHLSRKTFLL